MSSIGDYNLCTTSLKASMLQGFFLASYNIGEIAGTIRFSLGSI
jgi:hypothetical protein